MDTIQALVPDSMVEEAQALAEENYSTWGQYIIECYNFEDIRQNLLDYKGRPYKMEAWIEMRKRVADIHQENARIADHLWSY